MELRGFEKRKRDHLELATQEIFQTAGQSELDLLHFPHEALPEINFDEVSLKSKLFGGETPVPFAISGMTAGHEDAFEINLRLARACTRRGWIMGVGSQRRELSDSTFGKKEWAALREENPHLFLIANLGITQLISNSPEKLLPLIENLKADAIAIHLNALQEVIQPEGTPQFRGGLAAIDSLAKSLDIPVIIKETGCGFSETTLEKLSRTGIQAVDVSGKGGTHWGRIEGARADAGSVQSIAAKTFENWGNSTVSSVMAASKTLGVEKEIWASGGVRSGLDAAKLIALGASRVSYAKPALVAALESQASLEAWMELQEFELKTAMFVTGSSSLPQLRKVLGQNARNI